MRLSAWCPTRRGDVDDKASGVSRGDRSRNARLARLRELVRVSSAIVGTDEDPAFLRANPALPLLQLAQGFGSAARRLGGSTQVAWRSVSASRSRRTHWSKEKHAAS